MVPDILDLVQSHPWIPVVVVGALLFARLGRRRPRPRPRLGEVWFAQVPFEDGSGSKDRPVLVLAIKGRSCEVARFTSQSKDARRDHVRVPEGVPGLPKASWLNLRPLVLHRSSFRRRLGDPGAAFVVWYRTAEEDLV